MLPELTRALRTFGSRRGQSGARERGGGPAAFLRAAACRRAAPRVGELAGRRRSRRSTPAALSTAYDRDASRVRQGAVRRTDRRAARSTPSWAIWQSRCMDAFQALGERRDVGAARRSTICGSGAPGPASFATPSRPRTACGCRSTSRSTRGRCERDPRRRDRRGRHRAGRANVRQAPRTDAQASVHRDELAFLTAKAFPAQHIAVRLAAKEAAYKALSGNELARGIGWRDVEVVLSRRRFAGAAPPRAGGDALRRAGGGDDPRVADPQRGDGGRRRNRRALEGVARREGYTRAGESRYIPSAMSLGTKLGRAVAVLAARWTAAAASRAQEEHPIQRVANIVSVAVEEYGKGVDEKGRLISRGRVPGSRRLPERRARRGVAPAPRPAVAAASRCSIRSLPRSTAKKPPAGARRAESRGSPRSLGSEAALELPTQAARRRGRANGSIAANCASCHGPRGMGDGPAGRDAQSASHRRSATRPTMGDVAPAMMFRKISVGVTGTAMPAFASKLTRRAALEHRDVPRVAAQHAAAGRRRRRALRRRDASTATASAGLGDGAVARTLSKLPPELGSFAWQVERSDSQMAAAVRAGMPATPMPPASQSHAGAGAERRRVSAHAADAPARSSASTPRGDRPACSGDAARRRERRCLAARAVAHRGAQRPAEPTPAIARSTRISRSSRSRRRRARAIPGVVASMERLFTDFKGADPAPTTFAARSARATRSTSNMPNASSS